MGGKNTIASSIIEKLPEAEVLVDVFAGGCAVTHAAILSGKYRRFIVNDLGDGPRLFTDAVAGKYCDETRWISREAFFALKDTDPYVAQCWSFGNNGRTYIYGRSIEACKHALWAAIVWRDFAPLRDGYGLDLSFIDCINDTTARRRVGMDFIKRATKGSLKSLQRLQSLESLQRLQCLQCLESPIEVHKGDYRDVAIPEGAVVYCDPPYRSTATYSANDTVPFDYDAFYRWCKQTARKHPVFISEYSMPPEFREVGRWRKTCSYFPSTTNIVTERLYTI